MLYGILLAWSLWSPQIAASNIDLQKKDYLEKLAITIAECIERKDTDHSIFHGCIDWHSAVHGHWALLRLYRATGDSTWLHLVEDSIDDQMLVLERSLLREHPRFEMPYGRAWFLLLTEEYEKATGSQKIRAMGNDVAASLYDYLLNSECDLQLGEYRNQSWAYLRLLSYYQFIQKENRVSELRERILDCEIGTIDFNTDNQPGFFSIYGNYVHLLQRAGMDNRLRAILATHPISDHQLKPISQLKNAHHLSINYSRAWAIWSLYEFTGELRYREAYFAHVTDNFDLHANSKTDYLNYGHWVPQFGVYAITERSSDSVHTTE